MMGLKTRAYAAVMGIALSGLSACGRPNQDDESSDLLWQQSRTNSTRYAYLDAADLQDEFLFGVSVTNVSDFLSNALNMTVRPMKVKLERDGTKLNVKLSSNGETVMAFDLSARQQGRYEIDFASAGNDVELRGLIDYLGGVYTASDKDGFWLSSGAPTVLGVQQDGDTVVVDLKHTIAQVLLGTDENGDQYIRERVSDHPGQVVLRLFLKRAKALPQIGSTVLRTVAEGRAKSVGFFGANFVADDAATDTSPIQRFALGDAQDAQRDITFYLKDVPAAYVDVAKSAILSWNAAFDHEAIKVEQAPVGVDVGDPRYHVVKWFDGTDNNLGWAGVAKMITEPDTGLVMSGSLYIQGSTLIDLYRKITAFSQQAGEGGIHRPSGSIGSITFDHDVEEAPVVPYFSDRSQNFDEYMQGYYEETIAHEAGHVLGLRHNFRGSVALDGANEGASVMDYSPRAERSTYGGPGFYDLAALKWGYYGVEPAADLPFCTDEDLWSRWDCSQGDHGDALDYVINGLVDGTMLLTQKTVAVESDDLISSMGGLVENALKIKKLRSQLSDADKVKADTKLADAYTYVSSATPVDGLSAADLATVKANLTKLRELARKKEQELRDAGRI